MESKNKNSGDIANHAVIGRFPSTLYRAFDDKVYVDDLIDEGKFRLRNLESYTKIDDERRRDNDEGRAKTSYLGLQPKVRIYKQNQQWDVRKRPGLVSAEGELINPKYIMSCFVKCRNMSYVAEKYGRQIVKIDNPKEFAIDIVEYLKSQNFSIIGSIEGHRVRYKSRPTFFKKPSSLEMAELSYLQKPSELKREKEFRFVVIQGGDPEQWQKQEFIKIDLGKRLRYITRVKIS